MISELSGLLLEPLGGGKGAAGSSEPRAALALPEGACRPEAAVGTVRLYVTDPPCLSCVGVLLQFARCFPGVAVTVRFDGAVLRHARAVAEAEHVAREQAPADQRRGGGEREPPARGPRPTPPRPTRGFWDLAAEELAAPEAHGVRPRGRRGS